MSQDRRRVRVERGLLIAAILFAWAAGVNSATHHWGDVVGNFLLVAICLGARGWSIEART